MSNYEDKYTHLYNKLRKQLPITLTLLQEEELSDLVDSEISKDINTIT